MIGIDLFSGAGGMSVGAGWSGIKVIAAVEADHHATATYSHNHKGGKVLAKDIKDVKVSDFGVRDKSEPLIMFGGPPCQGFSTSNQRTRSSANPLNWLYREYVRLVAEVLPEWLVFENVRGLLETENGVFLEYVIKDLKGLGYNLSWDVLNAKDFGVPQDRSRLFIIGSLTNVNVKMPTPKTRTPITVKDAISDLPKLKNGASENTLLYRGDPNSDYAKKLRGRLTKTSNHIVTRNASYIIERYGYIPQGGNWENIPEHLMDNYTDRSRCHTGIYYRLKYSEPSVVIGNFRKNMVVHPTQNRGLSVREAARLQSFPDWFEFKGSIGFQQQQVGNAVPPLLAQAVFDVIVNS
ncbi:MAG: DNA cytosine methyltransferase [Acidobacteria bacterium]|nr:DNA cytosine methyltransferase [Acidobacteriota bacterium]